MTEQPNPMIQMDPEELANTLMIAIQRCAQDAAAGSNPEDRKDMAQSALALAQTLVILDPSRGPNGVPLDHEKQLEQMKSRAGAEAPSPKKKITVDRGPDGRARSYTAEG